MTGFGRQELELKTKKLCIEVKSLNSKQTDINVRIPVCYREKEIEIRKLLSSKLIRGKIDIGIFAENADTEINSVINENAVTSYYNQINKISKDNSIPAGDDILSAIIRLPEVLKTNSDEISEEDWDNLFAAINLAIDNCLKFRIEEGKEIENDIKSRIQSILKLLDKVCSHEQERIETIKKRLTSNLDMIISEIENDKNRYEQEIIYYLEKLDINEEKSRLKQHCDYFMDTLTDGDFQGKKLGFIAQEIGREINTLGSKANHAEMQKIVVNMKDELEKIKEQLFNVL